MMESQIVYILVDRQADKPIDIDPMSGGYPYCVTSLHDAQVFLDEESAKKYRDHFKDKLVIRKMKLELERDGWTWQIEQQPDCEDGVVVVYKQDGKLGPTAADILHLGCVSDAKALAEAILAYVDFAQKRKL